MNLEIQLERKEAVVKEDGSTKPILNSFVLPVMEYARSSGLLSIVESHLHIKMKTVKYSWQDKVRELMCSIVSGCDHTVTINHKLVPDTTLAGEIIQKDRFADQSGINRLLHSLTDENLAELETIFAEDYMRHGVAGKLPRNETVFVDLDMSGFRADGKTYEGTAKGYVGHPGSKGYKASFAYVQAQREVIGCIFDKGSVNINSHIDPLLELVKRRIGSPKVRDIVIRGDAAFGNSTIVNKCIDGGYLFLFRGWHVNTARKYSKRIKEWVKIEKDNQEELYAGEFRGKIFGSDHRMRVIVFKSFRHNGKIEYFHLLTNLPDILYPLQVMFDLYHDRQGIEAYFKSEKSGLHLKNLRTRNLIGIKAFVLLSCITHNMMVHALSSFGRIVKKGFIGIRAFVEKLACSKGWFSRKGSDSLLLLFTLENPTIKQYINCTLGT